MDGYNEVEGAKQMAAVQLRLLHQDQTNLIGYLCRILPRLRVHRAATAILASATNPPLVSFQPATFHLHYVLCDLSSPSFYPWLLRI
jgi:hypothetical protein